MSLHRFYLPAQQGEGTSFFLTGAEAHHASRVLRLRRGDQVLVLNGAGIECTCQVEALDRDKIKLTVLDRRQIPPPACQTTLLVGIPKGKLIESIIQKATELGIWRIVPLLTERVVLKFDDKEASRKAAKWQHVAIESIKQCGAAWLPQIEKPVSPKTFLDKKESFDLSLIASLRADSKHPRAYFDRFRADHQHSPRSVSIWIGPEGDFTDLEIEDLKRAGASAVTLGPLVLRVETAAVYCLSVINYEIAS
jgi:16S rRNA (uracil1498-N3)-methyltransferase